MKESIKTLILILGIMLSTTILLFSLGWTGYSPFLKPYADQISTLVNPNDEEIKALQERELELIKEIENEKILEAIKEQQKLLEEKEKILAERANSIQALTTALEEEKNNFLRAQELAQQSEKEKVNYQQKVNELAGTFIAMPPERAVERILALEDDLLIIDIMKSIDNKAIEEGQISITPYYYSLMKEKDASRILKKSTVTF